MSTNPQDITTDIELQHNLRTIREAERCFIIGDSDRAFFLLGDVRGFLQVRDEQMASGALSERAGSELARLHRHFEDTWNRIATGARTRPMPSARPTDFLELFRSNGDNARRAEAKIFGTNAIRVVAVSDGDRAFEIMTQLHHMPEVPAPGWQPEDGWGFEWWPADYLSPHKMTDEDARTVVAETIAQKPPPPHIHIEGALVWIDNRRFYVGFMDAWEPGAYPTELADFTPAKK